MKQATCAITVFITADIDDTEHPKLVVDASSAQVHILGDADSTLTPDEKASVYRVMARVGLRAVLKKLEAVDGDVPPTSPTPSTPSFLA